MTIAPPKDDEPIGEKELRLFRQNVLIMRDDLGISQSELARRIGRSPSYVCDVEHARRDPNVKTVALFAKGLGTHVYVLFSPSLADQKIQPASSFK